MAKANEKPVSDESGGASDGKAPKKKRRWPLILVALFVLAGAGGGGAWFMLGQGPAKHKAEPEKPPVFVNLDSFTVNLQPQGSGQFAQVGLALKMTDTHAVDGVKLHMPEIRNRILLLLSTKTAQDLYTVTGKEQLVREITKEVKQPLAKHAEAVTGVFFTSFVIQ